MRCLSNQNGADFAQKGLGNVPVVIGIDPI